MRVVRIDREFGSWRAAARKLLHGNVPPGDVWWDDGSAGQGTLLRGENRSPQAEPLNGAAVAVPERFVDVAKLVACHRDPARWGLLYRVLWRLARGEKHLLEVEVDDDVRLLMRMGHAVRFDRHKMTAFVRFRRVERKGAEHFVAWHRPEHLVVRLTAPFFVKRFGGMRWSILTPDECAHWDGSELVFTMGAGRSGTPAGDELEALWGA